MPLFVYFVNFKEAYDSVDRPLPWQLLSRFILLPRTIAMIRQLHGGMRACVWDDAGVRSEEFGVK